MTSESLLLLGCGKMGGALLRGWLDQKIAGGGAAPVHVIEPNAEAMREFSGAPGVTHVARAEDLAGVRPGIVLLAVKPQTMDQGLAALARIAAEKPLFLSIAAGKTLAYFARHLGADAAVVRSMPNTPASVGRGATVAVPNRHVSAARRSQADRLLGAVGEVHWVEDEALLDAVTALSGGGPAYVFLLIEVLAQAGIDAGLPPDLARRLARTTVCGSGELARLSPDEPATLRQNVTSPGGTTLEALKVLMAPDGLQPLFTRAIAAATRRSRELAG
ncbi:MAG: pyrroline-5-carboxylate reductase [Alphaproteobacteria bacterium]|nr:pyrroline-5-carboxylate reductase [Alphaproteobacteria bacterium]